MTGRTGADNFLLEIDKQSRTYLKSFLLQQFITWAEAATTGSIGESSPPAKRVAAILLARTLTLGFANISDVTQGFAMDLTRALALSFDPGHAIYYSYDHGKGLASSFSRAGIFKNLDYEKLSQGIDELRDSKPRGTARRSEWGRFFKVLDRICLSTFKVEAAVIALTGVVAQIGVTGGGRSR